MEKNNVDKIRRTVGGIIFFSAVIIIGILARYFLMPMTSGDQSGFLEPWYDTISYNGGFSAVGMDIGDYMPTYYYIIALATYLPLKPMTALKLFSCIADFFLAFAVMKIVGKVTQSREKGLLSFAVTFMLPTVLLDSAGWAQCDAIFTLFLVLCIYALICNKDYLAVASFTVAFVFKIQAIFLAPLLLVMLLKGRIRIRSLAAFPVVYLVSIVPALIAGGDFFRILTVYFRQPLQYASLNMTLPNIWTVVADVKLPKSDLLSSAGVMLAGAAVLSVIYYTFTKNYEFTPKVIIGGSALFALFVPYVLPHMHERYYYFAVVTAVILAFCEKKLFWVLPIIEFASAASMSYFLLGQKVADMNLLFILVTAALIGIFIYNYRLINQNAVKSETSGKKE